MLYLSEHFHQKIKQRTAKTVNKQGYIHVSYQVTEMAYLFFLQIFQVF